MRLVLTRSTWDWHFPCAHVNPVRLHISGDLQHVNSWNNVNKIRLVLLKLLENLEIVEIFVYFWHTSYLRYWDSKPPCMWCRTTISLAGKKWQPCWRCWVITTILLILLYYYLPSSFFCLNLFHLYAFECEQYAQR